jgi:hypothetical protein
VDALVALMRADVEMAMPPTPSWYRGRDHVGTYLAHLFTGSPGRLRLVATRANTQSALAVYSRDGAEHRAFAIKVLTLHNGLISQITGFVDPRAVHLVRTANPATIQRRGATVDADLNRRDTSCTTTSLSAAHRLLRDSGASTFASWG